ncbi:MAG: hypothetical protein ACPGXX_08000 [Planctomycetaceae bacterium]
MFSVFKLRGRSLLSLVLVFHLVSSSVVVAQVAPAASYLFPPVVSVGQTSNVQVGLCDWTHDTQYFVHHAKVLLEPTGEAGDFLLTPPPYWSGTRAGTSALPICREVAATVTVPAEVPPGMIYWQVANASGSSSASRLLISNEVEIIEHRLRDDPQTLESLPVAVSGRLSRLTEVDRYQFRAEHTGYVTVKLMARVFGSNFRGLLEVFDDQQKRIADFADVQGLDGSLTFPVQLGRVYRVALCDVDFRGDSSFVYRLSFMPGICGGLCIPAAGQRGTSAEVLQLAGGFAAETLVSSVKFPEESTTDLLRVQRESPEGGSDFRMQLTELPELVAKSPDEQLIPFPCAVTMRFQSAQQHYQFLFDVKQGDHVQALAQSTTLGGRTDISLRVFDSEMQLIAEQDDSNGTTDPELDFEAKADGQLRCIVSCAGMLTEAGPTVARMQVRKLLPGLRLTAPQQITLPSGGTTEVRFDLKRHGGLDIPVTIVAENLPPGVTAVGDWVIPAGANQLRAKLESSGDSVVTAAAVQFRAVWESAEKSESQLAESVPAELMKLLPVAGESVPASLLAVTLTAPFDLLVVDRERQRDVPRGSTSLTELEIRRHEGFTGPVTVVMSAKQSRDRQGIRGTTVVVPAEADRVVYPTFMPEWLATDITRRIVVHGEAQIEDPAGQLRVVSRPADARITMIMEGALLKLSAPAGTVQLNPNMSAEIPIQIFRTQGFSESVSVELHLPPELRGIIRCNPLVLDATEDSGTLHLEALSRHELAGFWRIRVTASAHRDGWPVVSEATAEIELSGN